MSHADLVRGLARTSDAAFALYVGGLEFPDHLLEASRFAEANPKGVVLMPRGHAKTTLSIYRAARRIGLAEGRRRLGIFTAVEADAHARSAAVRAIVESTRFAEVFPWAHRGVRGSVWTDGAWSVRGADLGKDFTCVARGLRGVRAGRRLDDLLADDLVGPQENATAAGRAYAAQTYWSVLDPMVVASGTRWFLGTRWHEDDLYAELARKGWPTLTRRAIEDGQALWPAAWPLAALEAKCAEMGSALFNLQYQNDPSGLGGNVVRREWFRYVDRLPERGIRRVGVDLNAGASERSNYTAAVEWWEDTDHNLYLAGAWRARLDEGHRAWLTGLTDPPGPGGVAEFGRADGPRLLWPGTLLPEGFAGLSGAPVAGPRPIVALNIEATQHQSTFVREMLARTNLPARAVYPDHDKVTRARTLAARYEAGKVFHLRGAPGLAAYEAELVAFPNGEHDDLVDAAVYGADLGGNEFYFTSANR